MSNIDWTLYRMIEREIKAGKFDYLYPSEQIVEVSGEGARNPGTGLASDKRDTERADIPGPSIARSIRGNEQNRGVS